MYGFSAVNLHFCIALSLLAVNLMHRLYTLDSNKVKETGEYMMRCDRVLNTQGKSFIICASRAAPAPHSCPAVPGCGPHLLTLIARVANTCGLSHQLNWYEPASHNV